MLFLSANSRLPAIILTPERPFLSASHPPSCLPSVVSLCPMLPAAASVLLPQLVSRWTVTALGPRHGKA